MEGPRGCCDWQDEDTNASPNMFVSLAATHSSTDGIQYDYPASHDIWSLSMALLQNRCLRVIAGTTLVSTLEAEA